MSFVGEFIQTFAGEDTLSLLGCMAVANGNLALEPTDLTRLEAMHRISNWKPSRPMPNPDWKAIERELSGEFTQLADKPVLLESRIFRLHLDLRRPAAYFHSVPTDPDNQKAINAFFQCIIRSLARATKILEAFGYSSALNLGEYNHKWDKPSFHAVARTGAALDTFGNIIQGCLLETGTYESLSTYEEHCGVILSDSITPSTLAYGMDWNITTAEFYLRHVDAFAARRYGPDGNPLPARIFTDFVELRHALAQGYLDANGRMIKSRAAFVRFCMDNGYFGAHNKEDWRPIHNLLKDKKGVPVSADKLAQSYQDIMTKSLK